MGVTRGGGFWRKPRRIDAGFAVKKVESAFVGRSRALPLAPSHRSSTPMKHAHAPMRFTVVMESKEKQRLAQAAQQSVASFMKAHPDQLDELFRFTDPQIREVATTSIKQLPLHVACLLRDRAAYLSRTRIVHRAQEAPRCRGKVIYTEKEAHAKANRIWSLGRGRMRVYHCPLCQGHHLTHTAHRDSDRQVA